MKVTIAGNVKDIKEGTTLAQLVVDEKVENPEYVTAVSYTHLTLPTNSLV